MHQHRQRKAIARSQGILHQRTQQRRRQIESELRTVENKILKWQEAYEDDEFPKVVVRERLTELEKKRSDLTAERGTVRKPAPLSLCVDNIGRFQARIRAAFLSDDSVLAKQYLHALIDRVDITDGHVRIFSRPEAVAQLLAAPPNTPHEVAVNPRPAVLATEGTWLRRRVSKDRSVSVSIIRYQTNPRVARAE